MGTNGGEQCGLWRGVYLGEIFLPKLTRAKQQPEDKTKGSHLTALDREYSFLQSPTSPSF